MCVLGINGLKHENLNARIDLKEITGSYVLQK